MSVQPLITFKAGLCETEGRKPIKVTPKERKGYLYVYLDETIELPKLCWRERSADVEDAELELLIPPGDATFSPYEPNPDNPATNTTGRFFVLKFESSPERQFFWMQSKPLRSEDPGWFSQRDLKIGEVVDRLIRGEEVDVEAEIAAAAEDDAGFDDDDDLDDDDGDEEMEDADADDLPSQQDRGPGGPGGAGADATGGDVREEGESSREGGADGARAASSSATQNLDAAQVVQNFLRSIQGDPRLGAGQQQQQQHMVDKPYPGLTHLLISNTTIPMIEAAPEAALDTLLSLLPSTVVVLAAGAAEEGLDQEPTPDAAAAAVAALSPQEKRALLRRVLRSPQFHQSLASLTMALRDGGLPNVAGALGVPLDNGGRLPGGMPLGGGSAVEAFVDGVKKSIQNSGTS